MIKLVTKTGLIAAALLMFSPNVPKAQATVRSEVIRLVNLVRSQGTVCGTQTFGPRGSLSANGSLNKAAQKHSTYMARRRVLSHTGSNGSSVGQRARQARYNFTTIGENIGVGQNNARQIVRGWLDSPSHCANLMRSDFNEAGVGRARCVRGQWYWTMMYGSR